MSGAQPHMKKPSENIFECSGYAAAGCEFCTASKCFSSCRQLPVRQALGAFLKCARTKSYSANIFIFYSISQNCRLSSGSGFFPVKAGNIILVFLIKTNSQTIFYLRNLTPGNVCANRLKNKKAAKIFLRAERVCTIVKM